MITGARLLVFLFLSIGAAEALKRGGDRNAMDYYERKKNGIKSKKIVL